MKTPPIVNPDVTNTDPLYWEKVLRSHGLSSRKGSQPRKTVGDRQQNQVVFVGTLGNLVGIEEEQLRTSDGKSIPEGKGPDSYDVDENNNR